MMEKIENIARFFEQQIQELLDNGVIEDGLEFFEGDFKEISDGFLSEVELVYEYGGEDQGNEQGYVYRYKPTNQYVRFSGHYDSYETTDFEEFRARECMPVMAERLEYWDKFQIANELKNKTVFRPYVKSND